MSTMDAIGDLSHRTLITRVPDTSCTSSPASDEASRFLRTTFGDKPEKTAVVIWGLPSKETTVCMNMEQAEAAVRDRIHDENVYCGVGLYDPAKIGPGERGDAAAVTGLVGLWADVDVEGPNHKGAGYPPTEVAARELLNATGMPPTLIIKSGGGLQAWWLFKEPWIFDNDADHDKAARVAKGWTKRLQEHAKIRDWKVDSTGDLARVLRVAGTYNRKHEAVLITAEYGGPRYEPSDFYQFAEAVRPASPAPSIATTFNKENLSRNTLMFLAMGAVEGQRNFSLYRAACDFAGNGADRATAAGMLEPVALRCGLLADEIRRTLDSAYSTPKDPARRAVGQQTETLIQCKSELVGSKAVPGDPNQVPVPAEPSGNGDLPQWLIPDGKTSTVNQGAQQIGQRLANSGRFFVRGGQTVRVVNSDGAPELTAVKPAEMVSNFETVATVYRVKEKGGVTKAICSEQAAKVITAASAYIEQMPPILVVAPCPILVDRDGRLEEISAYDRRTGIMASGPKTEEVTLELARASLLGVLEDFDFASPSDRSRALAAMITPSLVMGGLLPGRAPMDLGEADESQSGKGYRMRCTAALYRSVVHTVVQRGGGVGHLNESLDSQLAKGRNFISIDNVRGNIDLPALESLLTEDRYIIRIPYQPPQEIDPRRTVFQMTSNSAQLTPDLANRCSAVRIRKRPAGYLYKEYCEGDLLSHIRSLQPFYLGAVHAVVQEWYRQGRPRTREDRHDMRGWAGCLDYIVQQILRCPPLLDGHRETQLRMATPGLNWLRDVALVVFRAKRTGSRLQANDLLTMLEGDGTVEIPGVGDANLGDEDVRTKALQAIGRRLSGCFRSGTDVVIDEIRVVRDVSADVMHSREIKGYTFSPIAENAYRGNQAAHRGADQTNLPTTMEKAA